MAEILPFTLVAFNLVCGTVGFAPPYVPKISKDTGMIVNPIRIQEKHISEDTRDRFIKEAGPLTPKIARIYEAPVQDDSTSNGTDLNSTEMTDTMDHELGWGDSCEPTEAVGEDKCSISSLLHGNGSMINFFYCDPVTRQCKCIPDENSEPIPWSVEKKMCVLPLYYGCQSTELCDDYLVCAKANLKDYDKDPFIPPGYPKVCKYPDKASEHCGELLLLIISSVFMVLVGIECPLSD